MSDVTPYTPRDLDRPDLLDPVTDGWIASIAEVAQLAAYIADTAFVPQPLRGNAPAVAATILYGREIGVPPITALQTMHVINGRVGMAAELMRARVLAAGHEIETVESTAAVCRMRGRRRGSERWAEVQWSKGDAQQAGLSGDGWRKYPRAMLVARASAELCRLVFPDVTHGMLATEELDGDAATVGAPSGVASAVRKVARATRSATPPVSPPPGGPPASSPPAAAPEPPREVPDPPRVIRPPEVPEPPALPDEERMPGEEPLPFAGTEHLPRESDRHPTVDLPAHLEGPRVPTSYSPEVVEVVEEHGGQHPAPALDEPPARGAAWIGDERGGTLQPAAPVEVIEADPLVGDEADPREQARLKGDGPATRAQTRHVMALLRRLGLGATREERLHVGQALVGRYVSTFADLTVTDAGRIITTLLIALDSDEPRAFIRNLVDEEHRRLAEAEAGVGDD